MKQQLTIKIIQPIKKRRKDSFWYNGQVATVSTGEKTISIEAQGDVLVSFNKDEDLYPNDKARKEATKRGYTDRKLNRMNTHDGWSNNNWFAFYWVENDQYLDTTSINYNEAIKVAKELINQ